MGGETRKSERWKKMTPAETGVREYCANTREKVTVAMLSGLGLQLFGIG